MTVRCIMDLLLCRLLLRTNVRDKAKAWRNRTRRKQRLRRQCHFHSRLNSDPRRPNWRSNRWRSCGAPGVDMKYRRGRRRRFECNLRRVRRGRRMDGELLGCGLDEQECHQKRCGGQATHHPYRRFGPRWVCRSFGSATCLVTGQKCAADFLIRAHSLAALGALPEVPRNVGRFLIRQFPIQPSDQSSRIFTHCISPLVS